MQAQLDNNVDVNIVEPSPIINYKSPKKKTTNSTSNKIDSDPFLIPTIEKHTHRITLIGFYSNIVDFLKDIELLQTIVISDNIEIKPLKPSTATSNIDYSKKLIFSFDLSTYAYVK